MHTATDPGARRGRRPPGSPALPGRVPRGEEGSATVEFVALSALVLVPLVYLMIFISQVQLSSYAAVAVADQAARIVVSGTEGASSGDAHKAALLTFADYRITRDLYDIDVRCSAGDCMTLDPGEVVDVRVEVDVPLPFAPPEWDLHGPVTVESHARAVTPRF